MDRGQRTEDKGQRTESHSQGSAVGQVGGKKVLVTNIGSPLGQGIARGLAAAGADIAGAQYGALDGIPADLLGPNRLLSYEAAQPAAATQLIAGAVAAMGRVDGIIIVPHDQPAMSFMNQHEKDWDRALALNVAGLFYVAQAAARQMVAQGAGGRIVFITGVASEMPFHKTTMFGATQAAINTIARVAALELGTHGITVNAVAPGWVELENGALYFAGAEFPQPSAEGRAHVVTGTPVGHIGSVRDIADFCGFLLSDASGYISGAYLPIDGAYAITKTLGNTPFPDGEPWLPFEAGYDPAEHAT